MTTRNLGRLTSAILLGLLLTTPLTAEGEEKGKVYRIGALTESWGPPPQILGLRDGLEERGYREREDFVLGVRFTRGNLAALPEAANQLVRYGVDLIFASAANAVKAAQSATDTIPIVFGGNVGDPTQLGFVSSLARPGANITGITDLDLELIPKRLEIFKEIVPGLKRVLFVYDPADAYAAMGAELYRDAADRLEISIVGRTAQSEETAATTLREVQAGDVDGLVMIGSLAWNIPGLTMEVATERKIPTMFNGGGFWVKSGALASYGPDFYESGRLAARLVDKILKGTKPAVIPVETNPKIKLEINLKTAKALGLTIPASVLIRADKIVE